MLNQAPNKEASPPKVNKTEVTKWVKATRQRSYAPDQSRGVILSYVLKGEPPDEPHLTKRPQYQGKTLSQRAWRRHQSEARGELDSYQNQLWFKVIQLSIRLMILGFPYLEAHMFNYLQPRLWQPGETLNQSKETLDHSGDSANTFSCTSNHKFTRLGR